MIRYFIDVRDATSGYVADEERRGWQTFHLLRDIPTEIDRGNINRPAFRSDLECLSTSETFLEIRPDRLAEFVRATEPLRPSGSDLRLTSYLPAWCPFFIPRTYERPSATGLRIMEAFGLPVPPPYRPPVPKTNHRIGVPKGHLP